MASNRAKIICSVFSNVRVLSCSGFNGLTNLPFVLKNMCADNVWRSVCSVDFVEKLWESLWASLWERCEKSCEKVHNGAFESVFTHIFARLVVGWGKVFQEIYTW